MKRNFLTKCKILIYSNQRNQVINLLLEKEYKYESSRIDKDHNLILIIKKSNKNTYEKMLNENGISYEFFENKGILSSLEKLKNRWGILLGALIMYITLIYSSNVVWQINVEGNTSISKEQVIYELEKAGFGLGTFIPKFDFDTLHNRVLMNNSNIAWISVNTEGNVANVLVKETVDNKKKEQPLYTNIIASQDGYISSIIVINGKKEVSIGDVVKKGDLLINGVLNSQSQGVKYESAKGVIEAYVNKEINIVVPLKGQKKIYSQKAYKNIKYKIYNFPLNFSLKYRNYDGKYDTIVKKEKLCLLGIKEIPIETIVETYYEYAIIEYEYSYNEGIDLAYVMLKERLDYELKNSELISKNIEITYDKENVYLHCKLYCLENIAKEQEFFLP